MDQRIDVELGPVQETLLIPLLGRARETQKRDGLLQDDKALEIVSRLTYDFDKWEGTQSLQGATFRTLMFDGMVKDFLTRHPDGTVVEIGCGLNTRFERLDNGRATWVELDLPDSMALRRTFFEEAPRLKMIAASVLDPEWLDQLDAGPTLFVSEAVLIYLEAGEVERALRQIGIRFPGSELIMDTTSSTMVERQARHDVMRTLPETSWFRWRCDDPQSVEAWGLTLKSSRTFVDAEPELVSKLTGWIGIMARWAPWLLRRAIRGYRLNHYVFDDAR
ncbi:MAG: class I SAM-dependent methyltransferase [Myxococcota bacterium]